MPKKLAAEQTAAIQADLRLVAEGKSKYTMQDMADKHGVSKPTINNIKKEMGLTKGRGGGEGSPPNKKTISVPTTQSSFDSAVRKLIYDFAKVVKNNHDEVTTETAIKIGGKTYTFSSLYSAYLEKQEQTEKKEKARQLIKTAKEQGLSLKEIADLFNE